MCVPETFTKCIPGNWCTLGISQKGVSFHWWTDRKWGGLAQALNHVCGAVQLLLLMFLTCSLMNREREREGNTLAYRLLTPPPPSIMLTAACQVALSERNEQEKSVSWREKHQLELCVLATKCKKKVIAVH